MTQTPSLSATDQAGLLDELLQYQEACEHENHRGLVVICGEQEWCTGFAGEIISRSGKARIRWISSAIPVSEPVMHPGTAASCLGNELDVAVYDVHSGLDPDVLGAISGSVVGGGLLILLVPELEHWAVYPDPVYHKLLQYPLTQKEAYSDFVSRFSNCIRQNKHCFLVQEKGGSRMPAGRANRTTGIPGTNTGLFRTHDQEQAVQAICKVATGHRRRPLLLLSDRGRGKTASLGIAAAQLLTQGLKKIIITAPRLGAVNPLFDRAREMLPVTRNEQGCLVAGSAEIVFVPPDELLQKLPDADLLMVDEAAAIPIPMLEKMLRRYARIVFSSTVHGYEGTGRGFTLKFGETLEQFSPSRKVFIMHDPIRWADNDPLERFIFHALLLDASIPGEDEIGEWSQEDLVLEKIEHKQLHDEDTLEKIFGMLVMAHYRTRPMDLRRILDAPDLDIFVARLGANPVGVVLCVREGGLPAEFAHEIYEGRRRLQGHLVPQSLVTHSGILDALELRLARIMRIAVHPVLQRRGIGKSLVNFAREYYRKAGLDALGVSFGATLDVVHFWKSCGFNLCRIGFTRDASSGTHSFIMLHAMSGVGGNLQSSCEKQYLDELPHQLCEALRDLEPGLLYEVLPDRKFLPRDSASSHDVRILQAFASGNRGYDESIAAIWRAMVLTLEMPGLLQQLDTVDRDALFMRVLQKHAWADVVKTLHLKGKHELATRMRNSVGKILQNMVHED